MDMKIILASASPRRSALLKVLGLDFDVIVSETDETIDGTLTVGEIVKDLSFQKASEVAKKVGSDAIVIGADTVVAIDGKILGKPSDEDEAFNMLKSLSGRTHAVFTGFTIIRTSDQKRVTDFEQTSVTFKELSDIEIKEYIKTNNTLDKAGAYSIQGTASSFVTRLDGDYNNVVGLPIYKLSRYLYNEFNI